MTRTKLILSIAAMSCLLLSLPVHSQEPSDHVGGQSQVADAEREVKMHELELKMAELAVDEATVEYEKIKLHVEAAQEEENSREAGRAELELKQAAIRVEMRKVQSVMARLQTERARAELEHIRAGLTENPGESSPVQLEYVDDLGVIVIRGAQVDVERIRSLIADAEIIPAQPQSSLEIKIFSIAHGNAQEFVAELRELLPADSASPWYVTCDPRTNSVIVRGAPTELAVVEAILLRLDRE